MKISATVRMSIISLGRNPTRTMLTTLGIVIGIGAVITMMEIGNGSKNSLRSTIEKMGAAWYNLHRRCASAFAVMR